MGRRSAGLAVMLVAVFAVVVISAQVHGRRVVVGAAGVAPVPGPAAVGDCLLDRPGPDDGWGYGAGPLYSALRLAPCTGVRWGEVVSIFPGALTASTSVTTTDSNGNTYTGNPNQSRCSKNVATYLGEAAESPFGWSMLLGNSAAVGPTTRQRMSGQSWIACVITPASGTSATFTRYSGSVRNALTGGALPSPFASCAPFVVVAEFVAGPCDQPHRVEVFGISMPSPGETRAHLDSSCVQLIRWLMRDQDPTKGGQLAVRTAVAHIDPDTGTPAEGFSSNGDRSKAACFIEPASPRQLHGTLFGLGSNPVPLR